VTAFTWTHPNRNYLTACGAITYELENAPDTYLAFNAATRLLTLYSHLETDQRGATQRKIIAYPAKFKPIYSVNSLFSVTLTAACVEIAYLADRKALPVIPGTPSLLVKYVLAIDGVVYLDFGFNFLPLSCSYWKVYQLSVVTYPGGANVASFPWLTVDTG